jgi:hypothetical protein
MEGEAMVDNCVIPKFKDYNVVVVFVDMITKNGTA